MMSTRRKYTKEFKLDAISFIFGERIRLTWSNGSGRRTSGVKKSKKN